MTLPTHHLLRTALGVALMAALWIAGLRVGGLDTGLMFLAPAFLLLVPLLAGRYPGERRLVGRQRPLRRVVRVAWARRPRRRAVLVPRGGLLVGCSLAGRAPPR